MHSTKFACGKSLFLEKILMCYLHHTMYTWGQSEKSIASWIRRIRDKRIQDPGRPPFLMPHHPPNLEPSTLLIKKMFLKNDTQLNSLLLELLHNIGMYNKGLEHHNKVKPVLVWLTQHHPVLCESTSYKLKYTPFEYFMHYDVIKYVWANRRLGPHKSNHDQKWIKEKIIKH